MLDKATVLRGRGGGGGGGKLDEWDEEGGWAAGLGAGTSTPRREDEVRGRLVFLAEKRAIVILAANCRRKFHGNIVSGTKKNVAVFLRQACCRSFAFVILPCTCTSFNFFFIKTHKLEQEHAHTRTREQ